MANEDLHKSITDELEVIQEIADDMSRISVLREEGKRLKLAASNLVQYGLLIVQRSMRTETQQRKWLKALREIDTALEEWEDESSGETFDKIKELRKIMDDSFEE